MRMSAAAATFVFASVPEVCQNTDLPLDIVFVSNSATPLELFPGDIEQIYEINALGGVRYNPQNTQSAALTNAGVWGHDEGPSLLLADGRILWYWGDSVTAFQLSGSLNCPVGGVAPGWCAYQQSSNCDGTAGGCLGVDTVSLISAADVANIPSCNRLPVWDNNVISGTSTSSGTCPTMTYVTDIPHHGAGSQIPSAGFTYENQWLTVITSSAECPGGTTGGYLCPGESMLAGFTATGLFTLQDSGGVNHLYVVYEVLSQDDANFNFRTRSILLRMSNDTSTIGPTQMPKLARLYTFSQAQPPPAMTMPQPLPTGQIYVDSMSDTTFHACPGTTFNDGTMSWNLPAYWQAMMIDGTPYTVTSVSSGSTLTLGSTVPSAPTSCTGGGFAFDMVPNPDTNSGKFIFASPEVLTSSLVGTLGINSLLPAALRSTNILCFWGSGFYYRNTNLYLGCMKADDATVSGSSYSYTSGVQDMYYLTGIDPHTSVPGWTQGSVTGAEAAAVPLLSSWTPNANTGGNTPCIGEQSVRWVAKLSRFLLTYGSESCGGLWYRTATVPWGPWSAPALFFSNSTSINNWEQRIIGPSGGTPFNQRSKVLMRDLNTATLINTAGLFEPYVSAGSPYGPYQLPGTEAQDATNGAVTVFMNVSGFDFYGSWLLGARFYKAPALSVSPGVQIQKGVSISH